MSIYMLTDVACDLPQSFIDKQKDFYVFPMPYRMNGQNDVAVPDDGSDRVHNFYEALREGKNCTTSQVQLGDYQEVFTDLTNKGYELLYICFTSGCSGTYQTACMARDMVMDENPKAKIVVVDSLCPSGGEGMLNMMALKKRDEGMALDDLAEWVIGMRQHIAHWFTVDDLEHLFRGGRISKSSALIGSMMKIKPVLHVNFEGRLVAKEKVAGRKRSLKALAEKFGEFASPKDGQTLIIAHGDCREDAEYLADVLRREYQTIKDILIYQICPIVGAHSGPGTVALFFLCESR